MSTLFSNEIASSEVATGFRELLQNHSIETLLSERIEDAANVEQIKAHIQKVRIFQSLFYKLGWLLKCFRENYNYFVVYIVFTIENTH